MEHYLKGHEAGVNASTLAVVKGDDRTPACEHGAGRECFDCLVNCARRQEAQGQAGLHLNQLSFDQRREYLNGVQAGMTFGIYRRLHLKDDNEKDKVFPVDTQDCTCPYCGHECKNAPPLAAGKWTSCQNRDCGKRFYYTARQVFLYTSAKDVIVR